MDRVSAWLETTVQDLRFAVRSWTKAPTFAIAAIATLALGIGANTAIVSIASGVLVRPLPFIHPEQLVQLFETQARTQAGPSTDGPVVYKDFDQWRTHSTLLDRVLLYVHSRKNLQVTTGGELEPVITIGAERGLFPMLGVAASLGRTFDDNDPMDVAVASAAFWKEHFNSDPSAVGRRVTIDGQSYTLIGVMPDGFEFPYQASTTGLFDAFAATGVWIPWEVPADLREHPENRRLEAVVARVKPGVTLQAVRDELTSMEGPSTGKRLVQVRPLQEVVSGRARESLLVLLGAVAMVLLVACVNVMNLFLSRTASRGGEIALRAALGASRGRLMRQLLTESLLMALVAGAVGLLIGLGGSRLLISLAASQIPRAQEIGIDWRVFAFLLTACLATGIAFGLAPALIASRGGAHTIKRGGGTADALRNGLVVVEIALAFVLLAGAGLLLRTFLNLQTTNPGLNVENVLTAHVVVADGNQAIAIEQRVAQVPGVRATGLTSLLPLQYSGWGAGLTVTGETVSHSVSLRFVTPGYFNAVGIPLHGGRGFLPTDRQEAPRVILVNEALAREVFPGQDAIGRETNRGTIIGVIGDVRQNTLREAAKPEVYSTVAQNFAQLPTLGLTLVVRGEREPAPLTGAIRAAVREISPGQPLFRVESLRGVVEASMADARLYVWLVSVFAAIGLVLAMTGIYGVIAYLVTLRTREFGIRMALGADTGRVLRLVIRHGLWLTTIGLVLGFALAALVTRVLQGVLYGVAAGDPLTFAAMAAVLALSALAAYLVPARRAARVDPSTALRQG
jgi:putative ABC transport system permease protein